MALWGYDIYENVMYEPILKLFDRCYARGWGDERVYVPRPYAQRDDIPDCVFYRAYNQVHVVEAKRFVSQVYEAIIAQLKRYRGNYKYLALPDGDYYEDQGYVNDMIEERCGLILVSIWGRGLHAEFLFDSPRYPGDFSKYYV